MDRARDIATELDRRERGTQVLAARQSMGKDRTFQDWKDRISKNDDMYAGDWIVYYPDGTAEESKPVVINLNQVGLDDLGRLVVEVVPQLRCDPGSDADKAIRAAYKRESILRTWDFRNDVDEINHEHGLNLAQTGIALEAVTCAKGGLPRYAMLNPRGAYPRFANGKLVDVIVVQRYEKDLIKPAFDLDPAEYFTAQELGDTAEIEIIDYYGPEKVERVMAGYTKRDSSLNNGVVVHTWKHGLGRPPVAYSRLKSADGQFRGLFDQIGGISIAQNRLVNLQIGYAEQLVYSPFFSHDVENDRDQPGPRTVYRGRSPEAKMMRIPAAGSNPELFSVIEYLERQARAGANYPDSRQGNISQSIASASFVNSTMGNLTTMVKSVQKEVGRLWQRRNTLAMELFEKFGDKSKEYDLEFAANGESSYKAADIGGRYQNTVTYGAGAGLDALNKKQAVAQDVSLGFTSKETAREQTEYILDPVGESQKIERETVQSATLQRLLTDPQVGVDTLMQLTALLETGMSFGQATKELMGHVEEERQMALQAQQAQSAGPGIAAEAPPGMQNPEAPAPAPEGAGGPPPVLPTPPLTQTLVRQPGA